MRILILTSNLDAIGANTPEFVLELIDGAKTKHLAAYKTSLEEKRVIEDEVKRLLELGIIYPNPGSRWASPVVLVKKKNGEMRMCIDYRHLNSQTKMWQYPLPHFNDTVQKLGEATVFSSIDLKDGYWKIKVREEDQDLLTFNTHIGKYTWARA